jgi:hypothetical protein
MDFILPLLMKGKVLLGEEEVGGFVFLDRILKGANALQLEKPIKQEFGGGYQIFLFDELEFYEGKT